MSLLKRIAVFVIGSVALCATSLWLQTAQMPRQAASIAVESVNGGDVAAEQARLLGPIQSAADDAVIVLIVMLAAACFGGPLARFVVRRRGASPLKGECRA